LGHPFHCLLERGWRAMTAAFPISSSLTVR
jgi:hypothetical protein